MQTPSRFGLSFRMGPDGQAPLVGSIAAAFRRNVLATPAAVLGAIGSLAALGAAVIAFARPEERAGCALLVPLALLCYLTSLAAPLRSQLVTATVIFMMVAAAISDLPLNRGDGVVLAAVYGAMLFVLCEFAFRSAGGPSHDRRVNRPVLRRATWVGTVALTGAIGGAVLVSLRSGTQGLGLYALALGAGAAVLTLGLLAALAAGAVAEGTNAPARRGPFGRGRRPSRGTKPA
jgi:hypothetical protein